MKRISILILGIAIWSLSLLWPDINRTLTPGVSLALIGLGGTIWLVLRKKPQPDKRSKAQAGRRNEPRPNTRPSRPINPHDTGPMRPLGVT